MKEISINSIYDVVAFDENNKLSFNTEKTNSIDILIENKLLPCDIMKGKNFDLLTEYEKYNWTFKSDFMITDINKSFYLSFFRIDTYSDIYINDRLLASAHNGFIEYCFNIDDYIKVGPNKIEIRLYDSISNRKISATDNGAFCSDRIGTRRTQCTYGWDWVGRIVSCGFYSPVIKEYEKDEVIIDSVHIVTETIRQNSAKLKVTVHPKTEIDKTITLKILDDGLNPVCVSEIKAGDKNGVNIDISNPKLWYPVGYGRQPLYTVVLEDNFTCIYKEEFGIREVKIIEEKDEVGSKYYEKCLKIQNRFTKANDFSSFSLTVNGERIFCKGANYVPCEPYYTNRFYEKEIEVLNLSRDAGVNTIRIWGGGNFETKQFYNTCSRLGILVLQDFLMACGDYPEKEQWFLDELSAETDYITKLIRNEPCIMWFHGDNENALNGNKIMPDYPGKSAFYGGILPTAKRNCPEITFLPSSPYGGNLFGSNTAGTTHNTAIMECLFDYSEKQDLSNYKDFIKKFAGRFISEDCQFGAVSYSSLKKFMTDEEIFGDDEDIWNYHSKTNPYIQKTLFEYMKSYAEKILGKIKDGEDKVFKYQYIEYEWVRITMELARREYPFCTGEIYWMLNDCWSASAGWALIDYYNKPKLAYYSFKRVSKPIIGLIDYENGKFIISVSNNSVYDADIQVKIMIISGDESKELFNFYTTAKRNNTTVIKEEKIGLKDNEVLIVDISDKRDFDRSFYKNGVLNLHKDNDSVCYKIDKNNDTVTLKAKKYVHAVNIDGDYVFTDNGFSMVENEERVIGFSQIKDCAEKNISIDCFCLD